MNLASFLRIHFVLKVLGTRTPLPGFPNVQSRIQSSARGVVIKPRDYTLSSKVSAPAASAKTLSSASAHVLCFEDL